MRSMMADEAAQLVNDGQTVVVSGCNYRMVPEAFLEALANRFLQEGRPKDLTLIYPIMGERSRGGKGGAGTGLNRIALPGLVRRIIGGSFSRDPSREINKLINEGGVDAYNLPMGTIFQLIRAAASKAPGVFTQVGLKTYVDPREGGGRLNDQTQENLARVVEVDGEEFLYYPALPVDVAVIAGTSADESGNVSVEKEAFSLGIAYMAMAAHNSDGKVIGEVERLVKDGSVHPRLVKVPGALVNSIIINNETFEDARDPVLSGEIRMPIERPQLPPSPQSVIARRACREFSPGQIVNLGAGIPMYVIPTASIVEGVDKEVHFTIEQGPFGGFPAVGGVAKNPDLLLDSLEVFDFYDGGGIDLTCLAFAQIDRFGNVNVSKFGRMMPGGGGFMNITHRADKIVFCGTMTAKGLEAVVGDGRLAIEVEGQISKFVDEVDQVTFNGAEALRKGQQVVYVTERAVFRLESDGIHLVEAAPGIDYERDVLPHIPFPVRVGDVGVMDPDLFF